MMKLALSLLFVTSAFAQDFERVFRLTHTPAALGQQEIATALRVVAQIQKLSVDSAAATITVHGPAAQIAFAEWLVPRLGAGVPAAQSYNVAANPNDMVVVYPLAHLQDTIELQEIITTMRTVLDFRNIYNISANHTIVWRGTSAESAMAAFLLPRLDHPAQPRQAAAVDHFHISNDPNYDTLSVYGLAHANSNRALQEIITTLRTVVDMQKIYQVSATTDLSMRTNLSNSQVAEWLIARLDRDSPDPAQTELKMPGGKDDVIHVFYLPGGTTGNGIKDISRSIRAAAQVSRMYWMTNPAVLVVRGTANSIAIAERLIAQVEHPQ